MLYISLSAGNFICPRWQKYPITWFLQEWDALMHLAQGLTCGRCSVNVKNPKQLFQSGMDGVMPHTKGSGRVTPRVTTLSIFLFVPESEMSLLNTFSSLERCLAGSLGELTLKPRKSGVVGAGLGSAITKGLGNSLGFSGASVF